MPTSAGLDDTQCGSRMMFFASPSTNHCIATDHTASIVKSDKPFSSIIVTLGQGSPALILTMSQSEPFSHVREPEYNPIDRLA